MAAKSERELNISKAPHKNFVCHDLAKLKPRGVDPLNLHVAEERKRTMCAI
jgi:hypothetical protein